MTPHVIRAELRFLDRLLSDGQATAADFGEVCTAVDSGRQIGLAIHRLILDRAICSEGCTASYRGKRTRLFRLTDFDSCLSRRNELFEAMRIEEGR